MSWTTARLAEFNAMRAQWPETIAYNGTTYTGIRPPLKVRQSMQRANYSEGIPDEFTMLASEFESSGLGDKIKYTSEGHTFEIYEIQTDESEPTVVIRANRKQ